MASGKISVAGIVIGVLITITTLVLGIIGGMFYETIKHHTWAALHAELAISADQLSTSLAAPLRDPYDETRIVAIIDNAMRDPRIYAIALRASGHASIRVRDARWGIRAGDLTFSRHGLLGQEHPIITHGNPLGTVTIWVTPRYVEAEMEKMLSLTIVGLVLLGLLMVLLIYLCLRHTVMTPLKAVARYAKAASSGSGEGIRLTGKGLPTELEDLRSSIETMVSLFAGRTKDLQESEQRYFELAQHAPVALALCDTDGNISYLNDKFTDLFGYTLADIPTIHAWWSQAYPDDHRRQEAFVSWQQSVQQASISNGYIEPQTLRITCKDGSIKDSEISGTSIQRFLVVAFNDLTERIQAQSALQLSEERFFKTFNSSNVVMAITEYESGLFVNVNEAFVNVFGYTKDEALDRTAFELGIFADAMAREAILATIREHGAAKNVELEVCTRTGDRRWGLFSADTIEHDQTRYLLITMIDFTERRRAEEALRERETAYRTIFHQSPNAVTLTKLNGEYVDANDAFLASSDFERVDILGKTAVELGIVDHDGHRAIMQVFQEYASNLDQFEVRFFSPNKMAWVDGIISSKIIHIQGEPLILTIFNDITARKRAEEALRESEEKYRKIFNDAAVGIFQTTPEGRYLRVNRALAKLFSFQTPEEMSAFYTDLGQQLYVHPADREELKRLLAQHDRVEGFEVEMYHPDKSIAWMSLNMHTVRDETGAILYYEGTNIDITARKLAESALRESERHLADVIEFLPDATLVIDKEGRITAWNKAIEDMTGYSAAQMIGKENYEYAIPFYGERRPILIDLILMSREDIEHRYTFIRREGDLLIGETDVPQVRGRKRFLSGWAHPIYDAAGHVVGAIECIRDNTDKRNAEEALKESEARHRLLAENASDAIFTLTKDLRYTYISPSIERIRGYTVEEALTQTPADFLTPASFEVAMRVYQEDLKDIAEASPMPGRKRTLELQEIRKDGSTIWTETTMAVLWDEEKRFSGFVGITRDISERKKASDALKVSEEKFRALAEYSVDVIMRFDKHHRHLYVNPIVEAQTGMKPEEFIGKTHQELGFPDHLVQCWEKAIDHVFTTAKPHQIEFQLPNGSWIDWLLTPEFSEDGNVAAVITSARDITERKRSEEALRKSEERYKSIIAVSNTGVWEYHRDTDYVWCSPEYFAMLGRDPAMFAKNGTPNLKEVWIDYLHPDDKERASQAFADYLSHGSVGMYENLFRMRHQDGHWVWIWSRAQTLRNQDATPTNLTVGIHIDITDRKRAEEERDKLRAQLLQVQKMESIGTLAGGIAHDFNNILSSMFGFTELAKLKLEVGETIDKELDEVLKAGIRARELVKQILTFSRKTDIVREHMDLLPLIKETIKFIRASLPTTIEINQDLRVESAMVIADPIQIHQILMNLSTNAAYAMHEHGGVLGFHLAEVDLFDEIDLHAKGLEPGRYVRLSVSDTGNGIPMEIINNIFDPFFTTKPRGEGTGMGLSVVHGIVKDMHGAISVYSELGHGTTFHVLLPASDDQQDWSGKDLSALASRRGSGRILFVDDEPALLEAGCGILEQLGYTVVTSENPIEALELFSACPSGFDCVLTDMTMPKLTGLELAQRFKAIRPDIPIVLCTGFSQELSDEGIREAGIHAMVMKPMILGELAEAVFKAMHPLDR